MASLEDELKDLKEKNKDLVQKVQYWKVLAGQRENEKINLMQEMNELRLQLSILRSNSNVQARNLEVAMQAATQKALNHLVHASTEIALSMDLTKAFREELATYAPRIGSLKGTPASTKKEKVHRVPPLMMGGQSIQPVVALTMLDTSNPRSLGRSPSRNRNVTERAVPMHVMLQDVHIPLTRIDVDRYTQSLMDTDDNNDADNSSVHSQREDSEGIVIEESQRMSEDEFDSTRVLDAVEEGSEPDSDDEVIIPKRKVLDNPLEGPSWMLDAGEGNQTHAAKSRCRLQPDSTTELGGLPGLSEGDCTHLVPERRVSREFSPTVRRRKRTSSPPLATPPPATPHRADRYSPRPSPHRRLSNSGRVLKVLVAKMRLDGDSASEVSPPKRAAPTTALDAPSPNGATVHGLIVSEASQDELESLGSGEPAPHRRKQRNHRTNSHRSTSSDETVHRDPPKSRKDRDLSREREGNKNKRDRDHSKDREDRNNSRTDRDHSGEREIRDNSRTERDHSRDREIGNNSRTERDHSIEIEIRNNSRTDRDQSRDREERNINTSRRTNSRDRSRERQTETERQHTVSERQRHNSTERSKRATSAERSHVSVRDRSVERNENPADTDSQASAAVGQEACGGVGEVRALSRATYDSDSGSGGEREGRSRRQRNKVVYKEKPLNRKMRR